jgi:acyl transferase domain-containing protein
MSTTAPRSEAASVGASDLFVLRRVSGNRFVHFGGSGRGSGWAGLIEVTTDEEGSLGEALTTRKPVRLAHGGKELVFGPYYARAAAFVPVTSDVVVVFGGENEALGAATDDALRSAATLAADAVELVTPAKTLADELEELDAVRAAVAVPAGTVEETMRALALVAAEALACEVGAVYLVDGDRVEVVGRGWELREPPERVAAALNSVLSESRFPYCVQDASVVPLPSPLDRERGLRSYYLLELTGLSRGVLFVAHTDAAPRGFTLLCRRLGLRLADVASVGLGAALTREWCSAEAARLHAAFGKLDV